MITPLPWLERNPTYKEQLKELSQKDLYTYGFLGYPVLQAADILMYQAHGVPVGEDQAPHVEMTREIARRFNHLYKEVFPIPDVLLTPTSKLLGIDRRKMSKSYNNSIFLTDTNDEIYQKVGQMITDPQRARKSDPGNPEVCNVFSFHDIDVKSISIGSPKIDDIVVFLLEQSISDFSYMTDTRFNDTRSTGGRRNSKGGFAYAWN